jgi:hypothetical protein
MSLEDDIGVGDTFESVRARATQKLPARFYTKMIYDEAESLKQGRPYFKSQVFIKVITGDKDVKYLKATDKHKQVYSEAWNRYKNYINPFIDAGDTDSFSYDELADKFPDVYKKYVERLKGIDIKGTLLTEWNGIPPSKALSLKYDGIFTIEQLIELPPCDLASSALIEKAKNYLKTSKIEGAISYQAQVINDLLKRINEAKNDS